MKWKVQLYGIKIDIKIYRQQQKMTHREPSKFLAFEHATSGFLERQTQRFPLNTFFSMQTFRVFYSLTDFVGGIAQYPLSLLQLPFGGVIPCRESEIQTAINTSRYRNINTDVI